MIKLEDIKIGKVFPPYQLGDFQKCPRLWDYKKRWQSRDEFNKTAMLVGTAVALGLEHYYTGLDKGVEPKVHEALCTSVAAAHVEENYVEDSDRSLDTVQTLVRRGTKHGMATNLGLGEILGVEKFYGRIRPDLVGRSLDGALVVIDHKVKMKLDDQWKEKTLAEYDTNNQFMHYAWAIGQEYGEEVKTVYAHIIVLSPRVYTEMHPVRIDQEHLALWLESATTDYQEMAAIEAGKFKARARFASCVDKYGPCAMYDLCHVLHGDESKAEALYGRKPERRY